MAKKVLLIGAGGVAGVAAAKGAGMYCIGFRSPHSGVQDLSRADEIVDDLATIDVAKLFTKHQ